MTPLFSGLIGSVVVSGATAGSATGELSQAVAGFLIALTLLIHGIVAERARRRVSRVEPQVRENTREIDSAKNKVENVKKERDEEIEALRDRIRELEKTNGH